MAVDVVLPLLHSAGLALLSGGPQTAERTYHFAAVNVPVLNLHSKLSRPPRVPSRMPNLGQPIEH